jgi:hypothetical protein
LPGLRSPGRPKGARATMECVGNLPRPDFTNVVVFVPKPVLDRKPARCWDRARRSQSMGAVKKPHSVVPLLVPSVVPVCVRAG